MKILHSVTPRRVAAQAAIAVAVGVAAAAGTSFAAGGSGGSGGSGPPSAPPPIAAAARTALDGLVGQGTIDQSQADAIEQQVEAGSIDPRALVSSGVVDDGQMHAVADVLDHVKEAAGNP
jgi:hypothetical protein